MCHIWHTLYLIFFTLTFLGIFVYIYQGLQLNILKKSCMYCKHLMVNWRFSENVLKYTSLCICIIRMKKFTFNSNMDQHYIWCHNLHLNQTVREKRFLFFFNCHHSWLSSSKNLFFIEYNFIVRYHLHT